MNILENLKGFLAGGSNAPATQPTALPTPTLPTTPGPAGSQHVSVPATGQPVPQDDWLAKAFNYVPTTPSETPTIADPYLNINTDEVKAIASKLQFLTNSEQSSSLATKALSGDSSALMELINTGLQNVYAQAATINAKVAEQATRTGLERLQATIPSVVHSNLTKNQLSSVNPALDNPAIRPLVEQAMTSLAAQHPTWTPAQLSAQVNATFMDMAKLFSPQAPTVSESKPKIPGFTQGDWSDHFKLK